LAQAAIDLAEGEPTKGNLVVGSPLTMALALRGSSRYCLGLPGWKEDLSEAVAMGRAVDETSYVTAVMMKYGFPLYLRALLPDVTADRDTAEALKVAERSGNDFALDGATLTRGLFLINQGGSQRSAGFALLSDWRESQLRHGYARGVVRTADTEIARDKARTGDADGAIELAGAAVDYLFDTGDGITCGEATTVLVESLLQRGTNADLEEAQVAIDRLAGVSTDSGFVLFEIPLLRLQALMARANGDEAGYRDFADRYRTRANDVGYEGHIALAEEMADAR
jgi:adenylate cyclase